jgi:peptidoglycan/xylan/chitin deacetylase (PgdA/CDA1 family)
MNTRRRLFSAGFVIILGLLVSSWQTPASAHSSSQVSLGLYSNLNWQSLTAKSLRSMMKSNWKEDLALENMGGSLKILASPRIDEMNLGIKEPVVRTVFPETPSWLWSPPGEVTVPILMYHHIGQADPSSRYNVTEEAFAAQMQSLQDWGFTSISLSLLVESLKVGAHLPPRPVVITFDDGYLDVYEKAWPVMERLGFTGVVFVITGQMEIKGYLHDNHLRELASAGWEIGSHTDSHSNLRQIGVNLDVEISGSKEILESLLGVPVRSFSFPYGLTSTYVTGLVKSAGYESAVGLGGFSRHVPETQYYLSRIEVQGEFDLLEFADLLPWSGAVDPQPLIRNEIQ